MGCSSTSVFRSCSTRPGPSATCIEGWVADAFSLAVHRFDLDNDIPWVDFDKARRKDDVMHDHLRRFTGSQGVLFVGRAQVRTKLFRTEKRRDANVDSYPVDNADHRAGRPFLLLLLRRRFRRILREVLLLFPASGWGEASLDVEQHELRVEQVEFPGGEHRRPVLGDVLPFHRTRRLGNEALAH